MTTIIVTGAAGFIGYHVCARLLGLGYMVVGVDSLNDYYSVNLKQSRLKLLESEGGFEFHQLDIANTQAINSLFERHYGAQVIHLAAQAGVRYSLESPHTYAHSNLLGFLNVLEACRNNKADHLVYASSSSVYGLNESMPFSEKDTVEHPVSLYAATKKANESMAHSYSHLYGLPTTGLRFFTVYGPWGRPDMSPFLFADAIANGRPINLYNHGNHQRDFTFIDDVVDGVLAALFKPAKNDPAWDAKAPIPSSSCAPWRIYNIGNGQPIKLLDYVQLLEHYLAKSADIALLPLQPGDVEHTYADIRLAQRDLGYQPKTTFSDGIGRFVTWYLDFYQKGVR